MSARTVKWSIGVVVLAAAFGLLFYTALEGQYVYYLTVGEFLDQAGEIPHEHYRVNGTVVPDSVQPYPGGLGATFDLTDGNRRLHVEYRKELPDTFVDGAEAVVEGYQRPDGVFAAHILLAKCPSKYEPEQADPSLYEMPAEPETRK
ncbi:MAG: cytochrome c maturation protein CcmE [Acidobacteriota bacterium]